MCTRAMTRIGKMSKQINWFSKALFLSLQLSLRLQVAVHRKQLLKVKFGLKVKIFSQWFESIIQFNLNLCHRAEIRHGRSAELLNHLEWSWIFDISLQFIVSATIVRVCWDQWSVEFKIYFLERIIHQWSLKYHINLEFCSSSQWNYEPYEPILETSSCNSASDLCRRKGEQEAYNEEWSKIVRVLCERVWLPM